MRRSVVRRANATVELSCGHHIADENTIGDSIDCAACERREIPVTSTLGRRTPSWDADSVPPALLRAHQTSAWAELVVEAGSVLFLDEEPAWQEPVLAPGRVVIVPDRPHRIEPNSDARFSVQFYDPA